MLRTYQESLDYASRRIPHRWESGSVEEMRGAARLLLCEWLTYSSDIGFEQSIYLDLAESTGVIVRSSTMATDCNPDYCLVVDHVSGLPWEAGGDLLFLGWAGVYTDLSDCRTQEDVRGLIRSEQIFDRIIAESTVWAYDAKSGGLEFGDFGHIVSARETCKHLRVDSEKIRENILVEFEDLLYMQERRTHG